MTRFVTSHRAAGAIAVLFGLATLFAGGRVLAGSDPGYVVFRPLLIYNTVMGVSYILTGAAIWRGLQWGRQAALGIFVLNLIVLIGIFIRYRFAGDVASESLRAMTLRTVVWLAIFAVTARAGRRPVEAS